MNISKESLELLMNLVQDEMQQGQRTYKVTKHLTGYVLYGMKEGTVKNKNTAPLYELEKEGLIHIEQGDAMQDLVLVPAGRDYIQSRTKKAKIKKFLFASNKHVLIGIGAIIIGVCIAWISYKIGAGS